MLRFYHHNFNIHVCFIYGEIESRGYHLSVMSTKMLGVLLHLVKSVATSYIFHPKTPIEAMLWKIVGIQHLQPY